MSEPVSWTRWTRRSAAVAVATLALLASCGGGDEAPGGGRGGRRGGRDLTFPVDVMPVEAKKVTYRVTAPGTIEAFETVQVTARVAGVVDKVAFTEGQLVKQGEHLVVIDSERFRLAANSARAAVGRAGATVQGVQSQVKRREGVSEKNPGLIPGEELELYRTQKLTASADQRVAVESLKVALVNLRDSTVIAPLGGVIQTRNVNTGQYVQPGTLMATLLRSDPLLLRFRVEPLEAPRLKTGMMATFTLRESLRKFQARITLVAASADPVTHLVPVTAEVVAEKHRYWLRPGSFTDVSIDARAPRSAPVIPRVAVRPTDHGTVVFVIEKDVARERVVKLGSSTSDGLVEIRSGLAAGDLLVVRGAEPLTTGAKVKVTRVAAVPIDGGPAADAAASGDGGAGADAAAEPQGEQPGRRLLTDAGAGTGQDTGGHEGAGKGHAADDGGGHRAADAGGRK